MTHRVIFLGSPEFAVPSLRALHNDSRFDVTLVVSQPDRPAGRGRKLTPPPVAALATHLGLQLHQPTTLKDEQSVKPLEVTQADVLVVVAYGEILRRRVLNLAPYGALNVHPSLLPRYRGASPLPAAILNGDRETGVSIMKLERRLDAGPVLAMFPERVSDEDTTASLGQRLSELAADRLPDVADAWMRGQVQAVEQDDASATYTREWTKDDARIDWNQSATFIDRLVRAALPWPVAWTTLNGSRVQIRECHVAGPQVASDQRPGSIVRVDSGVFVSTGSGLLELVTVQPESKRPQSANDWARSAAPGSLQFDDQAT